MPQDETGRKPDLSDLDSFAGVDELGTSGYEESDDHDPELDVRDTAFEAGGGSRGGIGGVGQLGDNLATGPVPDLSVPEDAELHELDDQGEQVEYGDPNGPEARRELMAVEAELNQRWPETKIEPSLTRISALTQLLGEPNRGYPVLHVAGTNGKGSTARMIDALLTRMGLRVGRYTSPHLQLVTERIALDGRPISAARYAELWNDIAPYVSMVDGASADGVEMSKFEILTGMAFAAFADAPVEAAVLEAGLGGAWDATNVADADVAVITPIGLDHVEYLGPDAVSAAREKAGIIKPGSVAVIAEQDPEVLKVLLERAVEVDAAVARAGSEFGVLEKEVAVGGQLLKLQGLGGVYDQIFLPLHGAHQAANAALALAAVEAFFGAGKDKQLVVEAVREAFAEVETPGRLERVRSAPTVLLDAAHNPHGARALATTVSEEFAFRRLVAVVGVMAEKDAHGILDALEPVVSDIVVTRNSSPRSMPLEELNELAISVFGEDRVVAETDLETAIETAIALVETNDDPEEPLAGGGVLVTGSVVTAGEARTLFGKEPA
ncbi:MULTISPECIES: bifunctional tetrahydrofolate synthase/dihydrofolate synthase [unclassified Amycolatopsis]|uniref:bifunctional tetrahydrofolate synthase/dihydrofolate synthase n=1 Tax=unclassified Amycolatopsis TaxID=2618356 RepID=UPI00287430A5|nr:MULTISPECIES: folylpolyglutamate synthase/dihydrofolate synthase family protein [unclassified Amycolatopsis]MDS0136366.1 bifunctional folylpolyglutamate synthase/dihydrofolate synthase [Amycolatopsis sp. 505]MDS0145881.1 bifunctional folylpolyglutamate synthase/dihydrofolate synthase [Amycolatopsis sp. CM201R]